MRVNLDGTRITLERDARPRSHAARGLREVVAAFGGDMPDVIDDSWQRRTRRRRMRDQSDWRVPGDDYSRKGFIDNTLRHRPLSCGPWSTQQSGIDLGVEHFAGTARWGRCLCPVTEESKPVDAVAAPGRQTFDHAQVLDGEAWGPHRVVNLPGITGSVTEVYKPCLERAVTRHGRGSRSNMIRSFKKSSMAGRTPSRSPRGLEMGFKADTDLDEIVNVFLEDDLPGQHVYYD